MLRHSASRTAALALLVLGFSALGSGRAEAQSVADRLRLSADLTFFQFTKFELSVDGGGDSDSKESYFGFLNQGLGLSIGAALGDMVFLGGRLVLERQQEHVDDGDNPSGLHWALEPFVELMFLDHGPVVPFAMAGLSIEGYVQDDGDDRTKTNYLGFRFGAGAHIFLADSFSLDPRVELGWSTDVGGDTEGFDVSRLQFGIVVGLSGWFGGGEPAPDYALGPAPGAGPGPSPTPTAAATTETLDFGGGVAATFYGTPGEPDMVVRFQRRGPTPVLGSCQELVWQVDGQAAEMRVHADQSGEAGDVLETLEGKTAASNARFLGSARVVTLTVCGASFSLTPQHLQQLGDFAGRMQPAAQPAQNDPWGRPAY